MLGELLRVLELVTLLLALTEALAVKDGLDVCMGAQRGSRQTSVINRDLARRTKQLRSRATSGMAAARTLATCRRVPPIDAGTAGTTWMHAAVVCYGSKHEPGCLTP